MIGRLAARPGSRGQSKLGGPAWAEATFISAREFLIILEPEAADFSRRGCGLAEKCRTQSSDLAGGYVGCGGRALGGDRTRSARRHDGPPCSVAAGANARQGRASVRLGGGLSGRHLRRSRKREAPHGGRFDSLPMRTSDRLRLSSRMMPADGPGPVEGFCPAPDRTQQPMPLGVPHVP